MNAPHVTPLDDIVRKANSAFAGHQYETAAKLYEECLRDSPHGSARHAFTQRLGDCYVFLGQLDRARKVYAFGIEVYDFPQFNIEQRIAELKKQ
jgi:tetratricopeptide (TPR) repeat protein